MLLGGLTSWVTGNPSRDPHPLQPHEGPDSPWRTAVGMILVARNLLLRRGRRASPGTQARRRRWARGQARQEPSRAFQNEDPQDDVSCWASSLQNTVPTAHHCHDLRMEMTPEMSGIWVELFQTKASAFFFFFFNEAVWGF